MFQRIGSNSAYFNTKHVISSAEFPGAVIDIENEKFYRFEGYRCYALRLQAMMQRELSIIIYDKWNKLTILPFAGGGESFEPPQPIAALNKFLNHSDNLTLVGHLISISERLMTSSARNYVLN